MRPLNKPDSAGFLLTALKEKLIKIGAKIVSHGRYVALRMAKTQAHRIH